MFRKITMLAATAIAATLAVAATTSAAPPPKVVAGMVGSGPSSVAGCPYIAWRLARHPDGTVTGIAYYTDLSGVSQVTGNVDSSGTYQLKLASQMGEGPVGSVTGHRSSNGSGEATLTGQGCANMHIVMHPVSNMAEYHSSNG